ncbi:hypothetical protein KQX54_017417 [Cotesia glomerata]|uniref:Uncharacterized protein n=1 Tax=Cotesia glomerata TaxID=32391 RepID=A0AAV7ICT1_COTGL|nr:hypothetical protein KQX54_017417 [Cotesia glomerata]
MYVYIGVEAGKEKRVEREETRLLAPSKTSARDIGISLSNVVFRGTWCLVRTDPAVLALFTSGDKNGRRISRTTEYLIPSSVSERQALERRLIYNQTIPGLLINKPPMKKLVLVRKVVRKIAQIRLSAVETILGIAHSDLSLSLSFWSELLLLLLILLAVTKSSCAESVLVPEHGLHQEREDQTQKTEYSGGSNPIQPVCQRINIRNRLGRTQRKRGINNRSRYYDCRIVHGRLDAADTANVVQKKCNIQRSG